MKSQIEANFYQSIFEKGLAEYYKKNYFSALSYFLNTGFNDSPTKHNIYLCYYNIGLSFYDLRNYTEAKNYFNSCLKYANNEQQINQARTMLNNCDANIKFDEANNYFKKENYLEANKIYNEAEKLFSDDMNIKICRENKGHCMYNYSNGLMNNAKTLNDYNNTITYYKEAKKLYENKKDKDSCINQIKKCRAYIYKINAQESIDINNKIAYIDKAIKKWPEGNNNYFINEKSRYLYNEGIALYNKHNYEEALNYFNKSYDICTFEKDSEKAKNKYNMIEKCKINISYKKGCELLKKENYNEAMNEFSKGLNRAKNINDSYYINLLSKKENLAESKIKIKENKEKEKKLNEIKNLKEQKIKAINEIKELQKQKEKNIQKEIENFKNIEQEQNKRIEDLKQKRNEERIKRTNAELLKKEQEKKFNETQSKKSKIIFKNIKTNYLKSKSEELINHFLEESKMNNNKQIISVINTCINNINFEKEMKYKIYLRRTVINMFQQLSKMNIKLKHFNIILVGPTGAGKSTLINTILQFDKKYRLKTQVGAPCTMGGPRYYESYKFKGLRLADSRGIEKNQEYGIEQVYNDIKNYINDKLIEGNPDQFVHCIWYCVSDSRFEDIEIEFIKKLSNFYSERGKIPLIIVYTKSIYKDFLLGLKEKIKKNELDIKVMPIIAQPIFNITEDEFIAIPPKGLSELIQLSIKIGENGIKNSNSFSINKRLKKDINIKFQEIKNNFDIALEKFLNSIQNEENFQDFKKLVKQFYSQFLISPNTIEKEFYMFYKNINIEGKNKIENLINSEINIILEYLQENQLKIFENYGSNFVIDNEDCLKKEIYSYLKEKLNLYFNNYCFLNCVEYYKKYIIPAVFEKIKELYNNFINTIEYEPRYDIINYHSFVNIFKVESQKLENKLKKQFEKEKKILENNFKLKKEEEKRIAEQKKREEEKKLEEEKAKKRLEEEKEKMILIQKENDEIDELFEMSKDDADSQSNKEKNEFKEISRKNSAISLNNSNANINDIKIDSDFKDIKSNTKNNFYRANTSTKKSLNNFKITIIAKDNKFFNFMEEINKNNK